MASGGGDPLSMLLGGITGGGSSGGTSDPTAGGTDMGMGFDPTSYSGSYGSPVDVASAQAVQGTPFPSADGGGNNGGGGGDFSGNTMLDLSGGNRNSDIMALVQQLGGARAQAGGPDVAPTGSSNTQGAGWFNAIDPTAGQIPPQAAPPTFRPPIPPSATSPAAGQVPGRLAPPPAPPSFSPDIAPPVSEPMRGPASAAMPDAGAYPMPTLAPPPSSATTPSAATTPDDPNAPTLAPPEGTGDYVGPMWDWIKRGLTEQAVEQGYQPRAPDEPAAAAPATAPAAPAAAGSGDKSWMTDPRYAPYEGGPPQGLSTAVPTAIAPDKAPSAAAPAAAPSATSDDDTREARIGQEVGANLPAATGGPGARSPVSAPASTAAPEGGETYAGPSPKYAPDQSGGYQGGGYGQRGGGYGQGGLAGLLGQGGMQGLLPLIGMLMGGMGGRRGRGRFGGGFGRFGHGFGRFGREAGYGAHGFPGAYEGMGGGGANQGQMNPAQLISDFLFGGPNALMSDLQGISQQAGGGGRGGTGYGPMDSNYGGGNYGGDNQPVGYEGSTGYKQPVETPSGPARRLPGPGTNQEAPAEPAPGGGAAPTSPQSPPVSGNKTETANAGTPGSQGKADWWTANKDKVMDSTGGIITGDAAGGPSAYAEPGSGISGQVGSIMSRVMVPPGTKSALNPPSGRPTQPNVDRSVFQKELAADRPSLPGARSLMEQAAWMVNGEVNLSAPVEAQRVQLETAFNRAQYKGMPLGVALRGTQMGGYYPPSTYSAGNRPNAAQLARFKAQVWDPVVNGSNVSDVGWGPMTGNASNDPRMGERGMVAQHQFRRGTLGYKMRGGDTYFRENVAPGQGLPVKGGAASNVPARSSWPEMTAAWPQ